VRTASLPLLAILSAVLLACATGDSGDGASSSSSGNAGNDPGGASAGGSSSGTGGSSSSGTGGSSSGTGGSSSGTGGSSSGTGGSSSGTGGSSSGTGGSGAGGTGGGGGGGGVDACGYAADGVWFEIDYTGAYTATNPDWTFSATPGFGEPDWAPSGESWPDVWDVYNNIAISSDPIGDVALIGPSGTLQVMLGLTSLQSYSYATVCVEGRSVSTNSSVVFDVYNPLNGCGNSATMSHDWTVHAVGVDLGNCMIEGNDFQALRVEASGGSSSLGVVRLRLTLHDAIY
jgi:hypothetical protein